MFRTGAKCTLALLLIATMAALADAPKVDRETVKKVKQSTVMLKVKLSDGRSVSGSGFFGHDKGLVLSNAHVLGMLDPTSRPPQSVEVVLDSGEPGSRTLKGIVLGVDRGTDLALLRVEGKDLPAPLTLGTAKELSELDELLVFGFPFGEKLGKNITVSKTSISSLRKSGEFLDSIQVSGGINPGNSGGPLTDAKGQVVGVAVSGIKNAQIQFAIPVDRVRTFLNGRLSSFANETPFKEGNKVMLPVRAECIDPLGRMKKVAVEVWAGNPGPPRGPSAKEPKPVSGDGKISVATLEYDGKGQARGVVEVPAKTDGKQVYFIRPVVTNGAGESRWMGTVGRPLQQPLERTDITLEYKPKAEARHRVDLVSQASFRLRDEDDDEKSFALNLTTALIEVTPKDAEAGKACKSRIGFAQFKMNVLVDKKPIKGSESLKAAAQDVRLMQGELDLDEQGGMTDGKFDLRRVPRDSRELMASIGEQVLQSMEVLSVPLPGKLKPKETWKARRNVLLGALGLAVPAVVEMEYTYLGVQRRNNKDVALISLRGTVIGKRGAERGVGGRVSGLATVEPETGLTVSSTATVSADMDVPIRRGVLWKANGTLTVKLDRALLPSKEK